MIPYVEIILDKPRRLRYGMNQLVALEKELGGPISSLENQQIGVTELRLLVWAGLIWEDASMTPERAGEIIDTSEMNVQEIIEKVGEALQAAFGKN